MTRFEAALKEAFIRDGFSPETAELAARGRGADMKVTNGGTITAAGVSESTPTGSSPVKLREKATPEQQLREAFERGGLSPAAAGIAARGRTGIREALAPTFAADGYKASDFAVATDPADDSTWHFCLVKRPGGDADFNQVWSACTDLFAPDGRAIGLAASLDAGQLAATRSKLSKAWDASVKSQVEPPVKPKGIA